MPYSSIEEASYAVQKGYAWGYLNFESDFSEMLTTRLELGKDANGTVVNRSEIAVQLDMSSELWNSTI